MRLLTDTIVDSTIQHCKSFKRAAGSQMETMNGIRLFSRSASISASNFRKCGDLVEISSMHSLIDQERNPIVESNSF